MPTEVNNFVTCPRCGHYCPRNGPHTCPPLAAETFPRGPSNETVLQESRRQLAEVAGWKLITEEQLQRVVAERDKLQAFKNWVHGYLDDHGVPHHPPGPHGAEGCRIGDRMDWLMAKLANAEQAVDHIAAEDRAERDALRAQLAEVQEDLEDEQDSGDSAYAADTKRIYEIRELTAQRDALAMTVERQAEQIRRLREALTNCVDFIGHRKNVYIDAAAAILKETAP